MNPLPCWLAGAHHVALNMCNNDLPLQLQFALFNGSGGYVLKPHEMRYGAKACSCFAPLAESSSSMRSEQLPRASSQQRKTKGQSSKLDEVVLAMPLTEDEGAAEESSEDLRYWPPSRNRLQCVTIEVLSLHNLPKRGEQRPCFEGRRGACHDYFAADLSGSFAPPTHVDTSSPEVVLELHPIGGFCAMCNELPPPADAPMQLCTPTVSSNGLNVHFNQKMHCLASEPHSTLLRIVVNDDGDKVAYETAVLGRLRHETALIGLAARAPVASRSLTRVPP